MREMKIFERKPSASKKKTYKRTTSKRETPKSIIDEDGELDATDNDDQENDIQYNFSRSSEINELRTPIQHVCILLELTLQ